MRLPGPEVHGQAGPSLRAVSNEGRTLRICDSRPTSTHAHTCLTPPPLHLPTHSCRICKAANVTCVREVKSEYFKGVIVGRTYRVAHTRAYHTEMIEEGLVVGYKFYNAAGELEFEGIVAGARSLVEYMEEEAEARAAEARAAEAAASSSTLDASAASATDGDNAADAAAAAVDAEGDEAAGGAGAGAGASEEAQAGDDGPRAPGAGTALVGVALAMCSGGGDGGEGKSKKRRREEEDEEEEEEEEDEFGDDR